MNSQREDKYSELKACLGMAAMMPADPRTKQMLGDAKQAIEDLQAATEQGVGEATCSTCGGHGWIGGPSYYEPADPGEQCPDCNTLERQFSTHPPKPTGGGVPECPYPCGWRELHSIITRKAAYFASATLGDEPWSDQAREYGIDLGIYARELCSLLATQQPPEQE